MPQRGQYDRTLGPAERWALHRRELVRAAAAEKAVAIPGALNVERIVRRAGRGRNTFYAHFSGLDEALRAVDSTVVRAVTQRVETRLQAAVTPAERLRELIVGWLDVATAEPVLMRAVLTGEGRAGELLRRQLATELGYARRTGLISSPVDTPRVTAAAGALFGLVRQALDRSASIEHIQRTAVDILLRIFR